MQFLILVLVHSIFRVQPIQQKSEYNTAEKHKLQYKYVNTMKELYREIKINKRGLQFLPIHPDYKLLHCQVTQL